MNLIHQEQRLTAMRAAIAKSANRILADGDRNVASATMTSAMRRSPASRRVRRSRRVRGAETTSTTISATCRTASTAAASDSYVLWMVAPLSTRRDPGEVSSGINGGLARPSASSIKRHSITVNQGGYDNMARRKVAVWTSDTARRSPIGESSNPPSWIDSSQLRETPGLGNIRADREKSRTVRARARRDEPLATPSPSPRISPSCPCRSAVVPVSDERCGCTLRARPSVLRRLMPRAPSRLLYVDHLQARGTDLFRAACAFDSEGVVAK